MEGIELNGKICRITKHAAHRAEKRKIKFDDIKEALLNPKNIRKTKRDDPKESTFSYLGNNNIILILNYDKTTIITLMRRNAQYAKSRAKQFKNKRQLELKRQYGNRYKEK